MKQMTTIINQILIKQASEINIWTKMEILFLEAVTRHIYTHDPIKQMFANLSFHEATVLQFKYGCERILIELEDVKTRANVAIRVSLEFNGVSKFTADDKELTVFNSHGKDGEILTLNIETEGKGICIIQWNDFTNHKATVQAFEFVFERSQLTPPTASQ